jgi:hypothetical protein
MTFFTHPSRRDFLQAGVIAAGSLILPLDRFEAAFKKLNALVK